MESNFSLVSNIGKGRQVWDVVISYLSLDGYTAGRQVRDTNASQNVTASKGHQVWEAVRLRNSVYENTHAPSVSGLIDLIFCFTTKSSVIESCGEQFQPDFQYW